MRTLDPNTRVFPAACTAAFCGNPDACEGCRNKAALDEFRAWVEETGAEPADRIWSPNVYVAPAKKPAGR